MTSTSMPWVKLFTEMLDDLKLMPLAEPIKWRFVQLILLAGDSRTRRWLPVWQAQLVKVIESQNCYALEKKLHRQFKAQHVRGEWYQLSENDLGQIQ